MRNAISVFLFACLTAFAQDNDPAVSLSGGPPARAWSILYFYTTVGGADLPEYICYTRTSQGAVTAPITSIAVLTNVGTVTTNTAHGLSPGNQVIIAGVSGGGTGLNTSATITTVPSTTTFTMATTGVANATYNNAGITFNSSAPRTNQNIWAIKRFSYGGTGGSSLLATKWAVKPGYVISGTGTDLACDSRTTFSYQ